MLLLKRLQIMLLSKRLQIILFNKTLLILFSVLTSFYHRSIHQNIKDRKGGKIEILIPGTHH